jgi:hypothetical protein
MATAPGRDQVPQNEANASSAVRPLWGCGGGRLRSLLPGTQPVLVQELHRKAGLSEVQISIIGSCYVQPFRIAPEYAFQ